MLLTQLASAYFGQISQRPVKTIAESCSVAVHSLRWGTTRERTGAGALWVQLPDWRGCWLWDRCTVKRWLGFWFASERGGEYICKLPRVIFRIDAIKDCKDSLSARNSKYWSKKIFRDIANHTETSTCGILGSVHTQLITEDFEVGKDMKDEHPWTANSERYLFWKRYGLHTGIVRNTLLFYGSWKVSKHTSFHSWWKSGMSSCFWICRGHLWWWLIPTDVFQWPVFCFSGTQVTEFTGILKNTLQSFVSGNPKCMFREEWSTWSRI